jgi:hypothetical protein
MRLKVQTGDDEMKITNTRICIDCEEVFEDKMWPCPSCTSKTTVLLAKWVPPISSLANDLETMKMMMESAGISRVDATGEQV